MKILLKITSRITCSFISLIVYLVLFSFFVEVFNPISVIVFTSFGFLVAWKGILILPIASLIIDEYLLNKLLAKIRCNISIFLLILIYCLIGMITARLVYGNEIFLIVSGVITSAIYIIVLQGYERMSNYLHNKSCELESDEVNTY